MFTFILSTFAAVAMAQNLPIITLNSNVLLPLATAPASVAPPNFASTGPATTVTLGLGASIPTAAVQPASVPVVSSAPVVSIAPVTSTITQTICAVCTTGGPRVSILPIAVPAPIPRNATTTGYTGPIRSPNGNASAVQASGATGQAFGVYSAAAGLVAAFAALLL